MKKKEKIVLTESKLKKLTLEVLGVGIIAYALLCLVQLTGIFIMQTASWVLLFAITAAGGYAQPHSLTVVQTARLFRCAPITFSSGLCCLCFAAS